MKLTIKNSAGKVTEAIINGNEAIVGRSSKCDVIVTDEALSRQHCKFEIEKGEFYVTDLSSANGVLIAGVRIQPEVKTPFNSFDQVNLGLLECQVEDLIFENPAEIKPIIQKRRSHESGHTALTKKIDREELDSLRIKKKRQEKFTMFLGFVIPLVILAMAVSYYMSAPEAPVVVAPIQEKITPKDSNLVDPLNKTPNDFLSKAEYENLKERSNCINFAKNCASLSINEAKGEAFVRDGKEYFIFLSPGLRISTLKFKKVISDPRAMDLIAFDTLVYSTFFDDYMFGEISQIHMILMDLKGRLIKVHRLHPLNYPPKTIARSKLIKKMSLAQAEGNPELFLDYVKPQIPSKDL